MARIRAARAFTYVAKASARIAAVRAGVATVAARAGAAYRRALADAGDTTGTQRRHKLLRAVEGIGGRQLYARIVLMAGLGIAAGMLTLQFVGADDRPELYQWIGSAIVGVLAADAALLAVLILCAVVEMFVLVSLWVSARMPLRSRIAATVIAAAGIAAGVVAIGPATVWHVLARAGTAVLPVCMVAGVGGWVCVIVYRRFRSARNRFLRHAADAVAAVVLAMVVVVLSARDRLGGEAAAGLLFPVAVWESVVLWRFMSRSPRLLVRAGADIATSLLLGAASVLSLVWLVSLLNLPPAEVAAIRETMRYLAEMIDPPHWWWAVVYVGLAAAGIAFAVRPTRIAEIADRLRIVRSVNFVRRVSTGMHIGLLLLLLVGASAPPAIVPIVRERLAARYVETMTAELYERGEIASYQAISTRFATHPVAAPLNLLVSKIDAIDPPVRPNGDATDTGRHLVRRLAALQASTVDVGDIDADRREITAVVTRSAQSQVPAGEAEDLGDRAAELEHQEHAESELHRRVEQSAELAALAVSQVLQVPEVSPAEVVQIVKEYLGELVENGPLRTRFAALVAKVARRPPPDPLQAVIPDPDKLQAAATTALDREIGRPIPTATDHDHPRQHDETGIAAAVDIINETQFLEESTRSCPGCTKPGHLPEHEPEHRPRPAIEPR